MSRVCARPADSPAGSGNRAGAQRPASQGRRRGWPRVHSDVHERAHAVATAATMADGAPGDGRAPRSHRRGNDAVPRGPTADNVAGTLSLGSEPHQTRPNLTIPV